MLVYLLKDLNEDVVHVIDSKTGKEIKNITSGSYTVFFKEGKTGGVVKFTLEDGTVITANVARFGYILEEEEENAV